MQPAAGPMVWDVAALVRAVSDALTARFAAVAVRGELSGVSRAPSGHLYFTLKASDGSAALRCAMFRRAAALLDFAPRDGMAVELRGRLALYEPRGELQLVVEAMRRDGVGALMEQFLRLKARLEAEGLFDASRKRALPAYPRAVGVVTSLGAAALRDVLTALQRRAPQVAVVLYPALVQGAQAPAELVQAIGDAARRAEVDTLIVCRGGGSIEDLWAFNDEAVVRAIAACPLPVISGVGHETDFTLSDFVADLRAPTPTAAAELAAPSRDECLLALTQQTRRMRLRVRARLDQDAQRLDHRALRLQRPAELLQTHGARLDALQRRLQAAAPARWQREAQLLAHLTPRLMQGQQRQLALAGQPLAVLAARLAALDPAQVLARGYAWVMDEKGAALTSAQQVAPGQPLTTVLADGEISSLVQAVRLKGAAVERP